MTGMKFLATIFASFDSWPRLLALGLWWCLGTLHQSRDCWFLAAKACSQCYIHKTNGRFNPHVSLWNFLFLLSSWLFYQTPLKATKRRALLQSLLWILRSWGILRHRELPAFGSVVCCDATCWPQVLCQKTPWGLNMLAARIWLFRLFFFLKNNIPGLKQVAISFDFKSFLLLLDGGHETT